MTVVAAVLEDRVFGGVDRLDEVVVGEGWEMWVEESGLDMLEEGKRRLVRRVCVDEEKDPREVVVENLNVSRDRPVMLVADLAVELEERGWVPWENILSVCWS